ncbi:MAG: hypothetical protein ACRD3J_03865 [Thermoanaerobaculia bacterium]
MSHESWLSLLINVFLSIPVGVAAAILTPKVEGWFQRMTKASVAKRRRQTLKELQTIVFYRRNPEALTQFLLIGAVRTFLLAFALLGFAILPAAAIGVGSLPLTSVERSQFLIVVPAVVVAGVAAVIIESRAATDVYWRVRYFDLWVSSLPGDLQIEVKHLLTSSDVRA